MLNKVENKIDAQFEIIEDCIKYQIEALTEILGTITFIRHLDNFKKNLVINNVNKTKL